MVLIGEILLLALEIFFWIIIAQVALSWLIACDVVNIRNPQAARLVELINKATDWAYAPLRRVIPPIGGIDITPIIIIFGIMLAKQLVFATFIAP
jgi:YggT family protein